MADLPPRYFNPYAHITKTGNRLPYWRQPGATYFITYRLADAIPKELHAHWKQQREAWLAHHPQPWTDVVEKKYHQRFSSRVDAWLDAGYGACLLRDTELRRLAIEPLLNHDGQSYCLHAWVMMPNHVHVLTSFSAEEQSALENVVGAWKSISARAINRRKERKGAVWQVDYFDRLIRDGEHFGNCLRYVQRDPSKARLREGEFSIYESEFAWDFMKLSRPEE